MVLGPAEQHRCLAVGQGEQGGLLPDHKVLDHHPRPGGAEAAAQHVVDGGLGLRAGLGDDHALAGGQTIGLDHKGRREPGQRGLGPLRAVVSLETRCRQAVAVGEGLGEGLRGLELRRGLGRPEAGDPGLGQGVGEAGLQRSLGPHHHQIRGHLLRELHQGGNVGRRDRGEFAQPRHARIARRDHQPARQGRLGDLPGQGVLAPAGADEEDVHAPACGAPQARASRRHGRRPACPTRARAPMLA